MQPLVGKPLKYLEINQKLALALQACRQQTIHLRQPVAVKPDKPKKGASMSLWRTSSKTSEALALAQSIYKSQAVVEFNMDGTIVTANQRFLDALGYRLVDITGRQYSNFVPAATRDSADYRTFWADLNQGK